MTKKQKEISKDLLAIMEFEANKTYSAASHVLALGPEADEFDIEWALEHCRELGEVINYAFKNSSIAELERQDIPRKAKASVLQYTIALPALYAIMSRPKPDNAAQTQNLMDLVKDEQTPFLKIAHCSKDLTIAGKHKQVLEVLRDTRKLYSPSLDYPSQ